MRIRNLVAYTALILGAIFTAAPFIMLVSLSFMKYEQTIAYPPEWIPRPPVLENYIKALTDTPLLSYFLTSLIVAAAQVLGHIITGSMAGYAFARFAFRGRNALFFKRQEIAEYAGNLAGNRIRDDKRRRFPAGKYIRTDGNCLGFENFLPLKTKFDGVGNYIG